MCGPCIAAIAGLTIFRDQFEKICKREVQVPGITIMRDVAISKSEFVPDQKAVTKIQTWHEDEVLWEYCALPEVSFAFAFVIICTVMQSSR